MQRVYKIGQRRLIFAYLAIFFLVNNCAFAMQIDDIPYAILMDYDSGTVLYEQKPDERMTPSSMSKLMTIYMAFEMIKSPDYNITLDTVFETTHEAWSRRGSSMFLKIGQKVKLSDLLKGMIVVSGNDACITFATGAGRHLGCNLGEKSRQCFLRRLQEKASELGLSGSNFVNESGWPENNHYMTARDVMKISIALYEKFPEFYHFFSIKELEFNSVKQKNTNNMLNLKRFQDLGLDGVKTGKTTDGKYSVSFSAMLDGRRLFGVVNGLENQEKRAEAVYNLLSYGLYNFHNIDLFKREEVVAKIYVWANGFRKIPVTVKEDITITHAVGDRKKIKLRIDHEKSYHDAIDTDTAIATLVINSCNQVKEIPLYSAENIPAPNFLTRAWYKLVLYAGNILNVGN